ncbi:hypothetical protein F1559_004507 [Cyanidiococcus yangmingshanensis]|uniref:Uncharacterized protein n=1 Tax=Cyanidiococcus yangmingshanensis TaxID=2690220 RepID=A0A7J7IK56_9RHOD|nr:hypothetical protein F1559_004507 [Cyanidiococcus yangmingshanensis]
MLGFGLETDPVGRDRSDQTTLDGVQEQKLPLESELRARYTKAAVAFAEERLAEATSGFVEILRLVRKQDVSPEHTSKQNSSQPPWLKRLGYLSAWSLGQLYEKQGDCELALQAYSDALRFQRDAVLVWLKAAAMAYNVGHLGVCRFALERSGRLMSRSKNMLPVWRYMLQGLRRQLDARLGTGDTTDHAVADSKGLTEKEHDEKRRRLCKDLRRAHLPIRTIHIDGRELQGAQLVSVLEQVARMVKEFSNSNAGVPLMATKITLVYQSGESNVPNTSVLATARYAASECSQQVTKRPEHDLETSVRTSFLSRPGADQTERTEEKISSTLESSPGSLQYIQASRSPVHVEADQGPRESSQSKDKVSIQVNKECIQRNFIEATSQAPANEKDACISQFLKEALPEQNRLQVVDQQPPRSSARASQPESTAQPTRERDATAEVASSLGAEACNDPVAPNGSQRPQAEEEDGSPARRTRRSRRHESDSSQRSGLDQRMHEVQSSSTAFHGPENHAAVEPLESDTLSSQRAAMMDAMERLRIKLRGALAQGQSCWEQPAALTEITAVLQVSDDTRNPSDQALLIEEQNTRKHSENSDTSVPLIDLVAMVLTDALDLAVLVPTKHRAAAASMTCSLYRFWQRAYTTRPVSFLLGPAQGATADVSRSTAWLQWTRRRLALLEYAVCAKDWPLVDECLQKNRLWIDRLCARTEITSEVYVRAMARHLFLHALVLQTRKQWSSSTSLLRRAIRLLSECDSSRETANNHYSDSVQHANAVSVVHEKPRLQQQYQDVVVDLQQAPEQRLANDEQSNSFVTRLEQGSAMRLRYQDALMAMVRENDVPKEPVSASSMAPRVYADPRDLGSWTGKEARLVHGRGNVAMTTSPARSLERYVEDAQRDAVDIAGTISGLGVVKNAAARAASIVGISSQCPQHRAVSCTRSGVRTRRQHRIDTAEQHIPDTAGDVAAKKSQDASAEARSEQSDQEWLTELALLNYSWFAGMDPDQMNEDSFAFNATKCRLQSTDMLQWLQFAEFNELMQQLESRAADAPDTSAVLHRLLPYVGAPMATVQAQLGQVLPQYEGGTALLAAQELVHLVRRHKLPRQGSNDAHALPETPSNEALLSSLKPSPHLWSRLADLGHELRRQLTLLVYDQKPCAMEVLQKLYHILGRALAPLVDLLFAFEPADSVIGRSLYEHMVIEWASVLALYVIGVEHALAQGLMQRQETALVLPPSASIHLLLHFLASRSRQVSPTVQRRVPERTREAYALLIRLYARLLWQPADDLGLDRYLAECPFCPVEWNSKARSRGDWERIQCLQFLYGIDWSVIWLRPSPPDVPDTSKWLLIESLQSEIQPIEEEALLHMLHLCREELDEALVGRSRPRIRTLWQWTRRLAQKATPTKRMHPSSPYRDLVLYHYRFLMEYLDLEYKRIAEPERRARILPAELVEAVLDVVQTLWPYFQQSTIPSWDAASCRSVTSAATEQRLVGTSFANSAADGLSVASEQALTLSKKVADTKTTFQGNDSENASDASPAAMETSAAEVGQRTESGTCPPPSMPKTFTTELTGSQRPRMDLVSRPDDGGHPNHSISGTLSSVAADRQPIRTTLADDDLPGQTSMLQARLDDPELTLAMASSLRHAAQLTLETAELIGDNNRFILDKYADWLVAAYRLATSVQPVERMQPCESGTTLPGPYQSQQALWEALFCAYLLLPFHFPEAAWNTLPAAMISSLNIVRTSIPKLVIALRTQIESSASGASTETEATAETVLLLHYIAWLHGMSCERWSTRSMYEC